MRGTNCLFRGRGRKPAKEPIAFVEILPLKLKPSVSGKSNRTSENICLQELNVLLSCLRKHDFHQATCHNEITGFKNCFKNSMDQKRLLQEQEKRGEVKSGTRDLSYKEINKILKRYPLQ